MIKKNENMVLKARLTAQWASKENYSKMSIIFKWNSGQAWGLGFPLQWFDIGFFLNWGCNRQICWVQTRWEEYSELNTCKGGRQELMHSRRIIYHHNSDKEDRLVPRDVHGWWVAWDISRKATGITTLRGRGI